MEKSATLFTLFAKEDEPFAEQLTVALSLLRRKGVLQDYYDKEISPSESWNEQTRLQFTNSNYLVFLISPALLASGYFQDPAIQQAVSLAEQEHLKIINILIRYCDFSKEPVSQFGLLPANGEPVESGRWGHPQNAWNAVMDGIKESITGEKPAAPVPGLSFTNQAAQSSARRSAMSWPLQLLLSIVVLAAMGGITYYLVNYEPAVSNETAANTTAVPDTVFVAPATESPLASAEPTAEEIAKENKTLQNKKTAKAAAIKRAATKPAMNLAKPLLDTVEKKPEPPPPPKTPSIKSTELEQMLFNFSQGKVDENNFSPYLCNQLQTPVRFDKKSMTFQQMCAAIKKVKPKRIKKITVLSATYDNSCISALEVDLKKKGLLSLLD